MDAVRLDAEPLQPDLSRRGAGDDEAVCCGRDWGYSEEALARGKLTRRWVAEATKRSETDQFSKAIYSKTEEADKKGVDRLGEVAERRGIPRATLALAWMLSKPVITSPIVGATKPTHLTDAVAARRGSLAVGG